MKPSVYVLLGMGLFAAAQVQAADRQLFLPIEDALQTPTAQEVLNPNIKLHFARGGGEVLVRDVVTNKKTNAFAKSDEKACAHVFLSAVRQLQDRAEKEGGSGVSNIVSYYKRNVHASTQEYECHAGGVIAGVALKGDVVR